MCWTSKYPPIRRSAPTSLIVYKVVVYISPSRCRSFIMWFDYIYKHEYIEPYLNIEELGDIYIYRWKIYRGFHSFVSLDKAVEEYKKASLGDRRIALVECIIPKDSTFYKNEKDEIVSDRIIINRVLKTNAKLPCAWNIIYLFIIIILSCFILFKVFIS